MDLKSFKIYSLAYGFLFFVISISGRLLKLANIISLILIFWRRLA